MHALEVSWRASPHCTLVNLVRSGRKQPQLVSASAGGLARHPAFPLIFSVVLCR